MYMSRLQNFIHKLENMRSCLVKQDKIIIVESELLCNKCLMNICYSFKVKQVYRVAHRIS